MTSELDRVRGLLGVPESSIDFENMSADCSRDLWRIVNAANPADDEEPITTDWLRSVGFHPVPSDMGLGYSDHMQLGRLNIWEFNDTGEWLFRDYDQLSLRSRGDVRRFCAFLKIPLKS